MAKGKSSGQNLKVRAYRFAQEALRLIDELPNQKAYWSLGDQLLRSATSIGANIIEAQAASSRRDFRNFYNHALKSANETKFWLALIRDSGKIRPETPNRLLAEAKELANILAACILTLKGKR